jgi:hypothetical protein
MLDRIRIEVPDDSVVAALRRLTPGDRLAIASRMWVSARNAILQMLRADHPQWSELELGEEVARRMLHGAV